jgi:hypothetical protein
MRKIFWKAAFLLGPLLVCFPALATPVVVSLSNGSPSYTAGQTFSVDLLADIPDPILAFGLDADFDTTQLLLDSFTVGPSWFSATGTEANDYLGLAFPDPVSGNGTLLGTFSFTALVDGSSTITLAYDSENLSEGFLLLSGGFAENNLPDEAPISTPVPEPQSASMVATGLFAAVAMTMYARRRPRFQDTAL